jgi:hypothetical protein
LASHQAISSSRAKPEAARNRICTRGQAWRIRSMIRATSSTVSAEASMFEDRSRAALRCRPQNTYKVAVATVVAVEEPALLLAMQGIIRGVEIQGDLLGRPRVRLQEQVDEQMDERGRVVTDLVIAVVRAWRDVFQPVERALAGEQRAVRALGLEPVGEQREHRVVAQLVVVVHVLVAQGNADDPLPDQGRQGVHHVALLPVVLKACGDPLDQPERAIGVPQQQPAAVRGHRTGVERRHHPTPPKAFQLELFRGTRCRHRTRTRIR